MKCPIDDIDLVMTDRQGIEIDYCPKCRGVWLDRGELDKLIERSASAPTPRVDVPHQEQTFLPQQYQRPQYEDRGYRGHYRHDDDDDDHRHRRGYHHKRKSFLGEIFDF
jgi:uncharacterized protein